MHISKKKMLSIAIIPLIISLIINFKPTGTFISSEDKETAADAYCMAYGHLSLYELPVFSDMVIKKSTEYKFAEGQIAHRGDVFCGGNAAAYNAFIRVKKSAT